MVNPQDLPALTAVNMAPQACHCGSQAAQGRLCAGRHHGAALELATQFSLHQSQLCALKGARPGVQEFFLNPNTVGETTTTFHAAGYQW